MQLTPNDPKENPMSESIAFTGPQAVVSGVRFSWSTHCAQCRRYVQLFADGGSIEMGIRTTTGSGRKAQPVSRWYQMEKPPKKPVAPFVCPLCGRERWLTLNSLDWKPPLPSSTAYSLVSGAWDRIRAQYPDLARAADAGRSSVTIVNANR